MRFAALRSNVGYKLFSLVLSVMLYYIASAQQNPRGTRDQYVQPEIVKLPNTLVMKDPPALMTLNISGTEAELSQLDKQPLKAVIDGSLVKPGLNRLRVMITVPKGVSLNNTPPLSQFSVERKESRDYAVDVNFSGTPPAGQVYADPIPTPGTVTVQGLAEDLKRVGRVAASVERERDELAVERNVDLYAEDDQHRRVDGIEITPARVKVRVNLRPVPTTKTMLLSAELVGKPAPGYRIATYDVSPAQIVVRGAVEALSAQSSIPVTVDVSGIKASQTKAVTLALPPGMSPQKTLPVFQVRLIVEPIPAVEGTKPIAASPSPPSSPAPSPAASASP